MRYKKQILPLCLALAFIIHSPHGHAQTLPSTADTGRMLTRAPEKPLLPQDKALVETQSIKVTDAIPDAPNGFLLQGIKLIGNTAITQQELQPLIHAYIGRQVDLTVLNHLAKRIAQFYQQQGYFLTTVIIPAQEVENNQVTLQVLEGQVDSVDLDDPDQIAAKDTLGVVRDLLAQIEALKPLKAQELERILLTFNNLYGTSAKAFIQPAQAGSAPGSVTIKLSLSQAAPLTQLSYDNYGSRYIGPHKANALWKQGNVINALDTLTFNAGMSIPRRELKTANLDYELPLMANGLTSHINVAYAYAQPGYTLAPLMPEGRSASAELGLSYPLIDSRRLSLDVATALKIKNSATELLHEELIDDKIRTLSASLTLDAFDPWQGFNSIEIAAYKGLGILGATETHQSKASRAEGRRDFAAVTLDASREALLDQNFKIRTALAGQYTPDPLLSSEEFGYGGTAFGRAYDASEITGDQGIATAIELRYIGLERVKHLELKATPFIFYDIGKVWNEDTGSKPVSGASAGFGTYYNFNNRISGEIQLAYPLTRPVDTPLMNGPDGPRMLFSLSAQF